MMSLSDRQREFAYILGKLLLWLGEEGYTVRFGDVWRSTDELACPSCASMHSYQELLIANGRSQQRNSLHCDRLAADLLIERRDKVPMQDAEWRIIGCWWEEQGGRWGGRFGVNPDNYTSQVGWDRNHFELSKET